MPPQTSAQPGACCPALPGKRQPPAPASFVFFPSKKAGAGSATYGTAGRETGKSHHTSPILKGQVREPPDIAQPHCITHHGEDEIQLARPVPSGFIFIPYIVFLKEGKRGRGEKISKPSHFCKQALRCCGYRVHRGEHRPAAAGGGGDPGRTLPRSPRAGGPFPAAPARRCPGSLLPGKAGEGLLNPDPLSGCSRGQSGGLGGSAPAARASPPGRLLRGETRRAWLDRSLPGDPGHRNAHPRRCRHPSRAWRRGAGASS